ncbi:MAG: hypothetical protein ACI89W_000247 [Gammaproteobacteria bacterium]|jgi:hypothetical protein
MVYRSFSPKTFFAKLLLVSFFALAALIFSTSVQSSPGAHGPNGEHLNMEQNNQQTHRPKFEAFTESFELLGEVYSGELILYLHDFETNTPTQSAEIELEVGDFVASANYDRAQNRYVVTDPKLLSVLNTAGEHEVIVTILTEDNGDFLMANLLMPQGYTQSSDAVHSHDDEHVHDTASQHGEEHYHFPWWALGLAIVIFALGFLLGRIKKGLKS